jgi:putative tryptophan/tyrosine transport system substrate-binding protein
MKRRSAECMEHRASPEYPPVGTSCICVLTLCALLFALRVSAQPQEPKKVPRVGYLGGSATANPARLEAFRLGLRELGYIEGKSILLELRFPEGDSQREHVIAAELARLKVDVIVTVGSNATRRAKEATATIPIVMTQDPDPVGNQFVDSLGRPGGNITGLSNFNRELSGKRLELLKEAVPQLSRVAVFGTSTQPGHPQARKETELASATLGVKLQYVDVLEPKDIEAAFRAAAKGRAEAIVGIGGSVMNLQQSQVVGFAAKRRLPAMYSIRSYVERGGLMSYGVSITDLDRRAAGYVDKILKGRRPADLPVEQPTKFELFINLKAAKQIGVTIPPNVLARADKVIR